MLELMERLNETTSNFIRCVKPNSLMQPGVIDSTVLIFESLVV